MNDIEMRHMARLAQDTETLQWLATEAARRLQVLADTTDVNMMVKNQGAYQSIAGLIDTITAGARAFNESRQQSPERQTQPLSSFGY
jgi:hypothetical protein